MVISSSDGITFFGTRSPAIAFRAAPSERYPTTPPFSTVNERARQPDPNSLTDLAELGCDFAFGHKELSRGSQRPFLSPSCWHYFHFPGTFFFACGIIFIQCIIWEVVIAAASMQARVMRMLASNAFESPAGTILLGISATSSSFGRGARGAEHRMALSAIAALAIAALANICSAFWLLVCRCTARCWDSVHGPSPALLCAAGLCRRLLSVCTHGSVSCELDALIMP